eukprot:g640.t1
MRWKHLESNLRSHHSEKFLSSGNGRKLKGRPNSHANKHAQVVKNLKSAIAKLTEEKTTLSNEVKASARDAANKALARSFERP